jgi:multicomponent Na+:H+ antiporter subunit E
MSLLGLHLGMAVLWAMATGSLTFPSLLMGVFVGGGVLHLLGPVLGDPRYGIRFYRAIALAFFFLWELFASGVRVAIDVLRPTLNLTPAVIAVPLDLKNEAAIVLLANMVSLTPGTLSIDLSDDRSCLYVHTMYGEDAVETRRAVKHDFERRIQEVFR